MKSVLVFAAGDESTRQIVKPYRLPALQESLGDQGVEAIVVDVMGREGASWLSFQHRTERPRVVHTFGDAAFLSTIWRDAARMGCLLVHSVTDSHRSVRRTLSPTYLWTKHASRHVQAVLGSNRARLRDYIEAGFFPRAQFSTIVLPPVEIPIEPRKPVQTADASQPTFGYWKSSGADGAQDFLLAALKLTGAQHLFRLLIGEQRERSASPARRPANVSFGHFRAIADFVAAVDALIVPESDDRALEQVVLAVRDNKAVIAPDDGVMAEALGFGRHGVLFNAGNPYDLARSIDHLTATWNRQPFDFNGGRALINRTSPKEVARTFARAYQRLDHFDQVTSKAVAS